MPSRFAPRSYFKRQLLLVVGVNVLSLGIAALFLLSAFIDDYREHLVDVMQAQGSLLANTSRSALLFDDSETASEIAKALQDTPAVRYAQILTPERDVFAEYRRDNVLPLPAATSFPLGFQFIDEILYVIQPITWEGDTLGYLLISADSTEIGVHQNRYLQIVLWVFVFSLLFAYLMSWRLQKLLTAPVGQLVKLLQYVSQHRRYDKRVTSDRRDELGQLVRGVNHMLDTIEEHENQLQTHSDKLESLVALKTEQLFQRANYDALTQLPNRHLLIDRLSHGIDNADREDTQLALLFLDLDRFKVINDSLGHAVGDQLLVAVADRLTHVVRKADSVCRWGGDEFLILLEHIQEHADVVHIAEEAIAQLNTPFELNGHQLHISTSVGIARYPDDGIDAMTLLKHADISMYRAKDKGPGQYCFYHPEMLDDSVQRLSLENRLRMAVENQDFYLVYQPQICLQTGETCSFEALIRWKDNDEIISPANFLPLAEEVGLMKEISNWVVKQACIQLKAWEEQRLAVVPIAVNLPASYLVGAECVNRVQHIIEQTGISTHLLEIEITENTFIDSTEVAIHNLERLKDIGLRIAVDDFGTGYSCLSYLRDLPLDVLKIDGSFVTTMAENQTNAAIVKSIITLGQGLGLRLVGECVETQQQADILKALGCDKVQGYHYSRPLNHDEAVGYLR